MRYICILLVILFVVSLPAQNTLPGYYISKNNDTIQAEMVVKKGLFGQMTNVFIEEVSFVNERNEIQKFTPSDLNGYSFTSDGVHYRFYSKPTAKGENKFLAAIFIGKKSSLYKYGIMTTGSIATLNTNQVFYTFEKADGTFLFLKNTLNKKFRTELKEFYDDEKAQLLINQRFKYWDKLNEDLLVLMYTVNKF